MKIRRALLSAWDKTGLEELAKALAEGGVTLLATGGTLRLLREAGLDVTAVEEVTGFPEMLEGRVKTLHPAVHGGILAPAPAREEGIGEGIEPIDLVVVNLYPFEQTLARTQDEDELTEKIDIGGPTMMRAAAKNWRCVAVLSDPGQYSAFLEEWRGSGSVSEATRRDLAAAVFARTRDYDAAIAGWMEGGEDAAAASAEPEPPSTLRLELPLERKLRYGENPHQPGALYRQEGEGGVARAEVIQGKALSYNNLLDADAALDLLADLADGRPDATAVVIKHLGPCGAAHADAPGAALEAALACDPVSAFGGVLAVAPRVDGEAARQAVSAFYEMVLAPAFTDEALEVLAEKKNLRVLRIPVPDAGARSWRLRSVSGGVLLQDRDAVDLDEGSLKVPTRRRPNDEEWAALRFAWRVCKHVRSNAITFASSDRILATGGGQPNRVGACRLAMARAAELGHSLEGSALASDAFFPFRDGVDAAAEAGATCIIQPGGSIRDDESVQAADEHGMAMVLTGIRHFRH